MRQETKIIKDNLISKYPDKKFKFQYRTPSTYYNSSDRLIVTCERYMDIDEVISFINKHVCGIKVFKSGSVASIHSRHITSEILSINGEWIEAGLMEFIEVRNE